MYVQAAFSKCKISFELNHQRDTMISCIFRKLLFALLLFEFLLTIGDFTENMTLSKNISREYGKPNWWKKDIKTFSETFARLGDVKNIGK